MSIFRVAHRYAKSIIGLAIEKNSVDEVHQDMMALVKISDENPILLTVLRNPIIPSHKKLGIIKALFKDQLHPLTLSFFEIISKKQRENIVYEIAQSFISQFAIHKNIQSAKVITASPLNEELKSKIQNLLSKYTDKKIALEEVVDDRIIGGFILKIKDKQLDHSVKGQLREIQQSLH